MTKNIKRTRIIAIFLSLSCLGLVVFGVNFWLNQPAIGFDLDFDTGQIYQIYLASPNSQSVSLADKVVSIDGQPVETVSRDAVLLKQSSQFLFQDIDGESFVLEIRPHPIGMWGLLEHFVFPLMGIFFVILGLHLILQRQADKTSTSFFVLMVAWAIVLIISDISRAMGGWTEIIYRFSMVIFAYEIIEFHIHILGVSVKKFWSQTVQIVYGSLMVFLILDALNIIKVSSFVGLSVIYSSWIFAFAFVVFLFIFQTIDSHLNHGNLRIIFVTYLAGFSPSILFVLIPLLIGLPRELPAIIVTLPVGLISINYFLMIQQRKHWDDVICRLISIVFSLVILYELYRYLWLPFSLTIPASLMGTNSWLFYLSGMVLLLVFLGVYTVVWAFVKSIVFGDIQHETRNLQRTTRNALRDNDIDSVLIQTGRVFQEFFSFEFLQIVLRDGKVIRFDLNQEPRIDQVPRQVIQDVLKTIERNDLETTFRFEVNIEPLQAETLVLAQKYPQIFGLDPRYCFLLNGQMNPVGMVSASHREFQQPFGLIESRQLTLLLDQYQVLAENVLLLEESQTNGSQVRKLGQSLLTARETERKRIARDMHDHVIQSLTAFRFSLNTLYDNNKLLISDVEADQLQQDLHAISAEIRNICFNLRPPALDAIGLHSAIVSLVESYHNKGDIQVDLEISGGEIIDQLSEQVSICLYRVLQESLNNVARHAAATKINVLINGSDSEVSMVVGDNGKGFIVPNPISNLATEEHFGLIGLQEFLDTVNGELQIYSVIGEGSYVISTIPIQMMEGKDGLFYDCCG